jgi:hypothetical protein
MQRRRKRSELRRKNSIKIFGQVCLARKRDVGVSRHVANESTPCQSELSLPSPSARGSASRKVSTARACLS